MSKPQPVRTETADCLRVSVYPDRASLGEAAGKDAADQIKRLLSVKPGIRIVFAAAPSQNEMLDTLGADPAIDWSRIAAFHMDEYIGLPPGAPQSFGRFLSERLFDKVKPGAVHLIDSSRPIEEECARYAGLLREAPIDIVCLGIGENGHIAFNDPAVADFRDPLLVKPVMLDEACRRQQVNDGCFPSLAEVPTHAITLTIPALMSGAHLFCSVPGKMKRRAVARTLCGPVSEECPSTVLRTHPDCTMYVDGDSCGTDLGPKP